MKPFQESLRERTEDAERAVRRFSFPEDGTQKTLAEAVNYTLLAGGKRLRPLIMKAVYEAFGGTSEAIEPFMAGIEMIHSSSLAHDDLPCMDNDEYRRGKLTTWKRYGYDMAVLAGDNLLVAAFETGAKARALGADADAVIRALKVLGGKAGLSGMIGGQSVDVELTGKPLSKEQLDFIYRLKTGALLEASMMIGCILASGTEEQVEACREIASLVGMAFQIRDDILDETSTTEQLGKPVHSDERNSKTTYVTLFGLEEASETVSRCTAQAMEKLHLLLPEERFLPQLFEWLINREK